MSDEDKKDSQVMLDLQDKWKDEYAIIGDRELKRIVDFADTLKETENNRLSKDVFAKWTPISNKNDKIYRAKRRQWEAKTRQIAAQADDKNITEEQKEKDQADLEKMVDDYYAEMMELFYGLPRETYDEMPPSDASLAVEAALHHLRHPLRPDPPKQLKTGSLPESAASSHQKKTSG